VVYQGGVCFAIETADSQKEDQRKALIDAYQAAMNAERELWEQLKSMKSGSPAYEALWSCGCKLRAVRQPRLTSCGRLFRGRRGPVT
jgi:hypothetical protein